MIDRPNTCKFNAVSPTMVTGRVPVNCIKSVLLPFGYAACVDEKTIHNVQ